MARERPQKGRGDMGTRGRGDTATRGHGDTGTRGHGDAGTWRRGDGKTKTYLTLDIGRLSFLIWLFVFVRVSSWIVFISSWIVFIVRNNESIKSHNESIKSHNESTKSHEKTQTTEQMIKVQCPISNRLFGRVFTFNGRTTDMGHEHLNTYEFTYEM